MRFVSQLLSALLIFSSLAASANGPATGKVLEVARQGWELRRTIESFYTKEPYLHPNPAFGSIQTWTLDNQRYYGRHGQIFRQIIVTDPRYVSVDLIKKAYQKYILKMNVLMRQLPDQTVLHMNMIDDEKFKNEILTDIRETLVSIGNNNIKDWNLTCDYLAQPILTLWFLSVALEHLDRLGQLKMGAEWSKTVKSIIEPHGLMNLRQMRTLLKQSQNFPY